MFLAVDKPHGLSSFGAIRVLKKFFPGEKIGHSGTLDPMATGLMILAVGKDTKKLSSLVGLDKSYLATIDFSKNSDTRDAEYRDFFETLDITNLAVPAKQDIDAKLQGLIPESLLPLPPFSAKKKEGQRMYALARKGEQKIENRMMKIHEIQILAYHFPLLKIKVKVGSGTYVRSLAYRLGQQFHVGGILTELRRTSVGGRDIEKMQMQKVENSFVQYCQITE